MTKREVQRLKKEYPGIMKRVADAYGCQPSYVNQVIVEQISPGRKLWETLFRVVKEMKQEKEQQQGEHDLLKARILEVALA